MLFSCCVVKFLIADLPVEHHENVRINS